MTSTSTSNRVPAHTDEEINRQIREETERRSHYETHKDRIPAKPKLPRPNCFRFFAIKG